MKSNQRVYYELHPEQSYVFDAARRLGIDTRLVSHDLETRTCYEKARLLGWDVGRVVKAAYFDVFHNTDKRTYFVGIVTPETGIRIDAIAAAKCLFNPLPLKGTFYSDNRKIPKGMFHGTCTPFPMQSLIRDRTNSTQAIIRNNPIDAILIFDFPLLDDQIVDISVGGGTPEARKTSMHLKYSAIYDILRNVFPTAIYKLYPRFIN